MVANLKLVYINLVSISMLNPYIIEKNIMDNIQTLQKTASLLRLTFSKRTLEKYSGQLSQKTRKQMLACIQVLKVVRKEYKCPQCEQVFDEGRKLGGHISRAHKRRNSVKIEELQSQVKSEQIEWDNESERNPRKKRRGKKQDQTKCACPAPIAEGQKVQIYQEDD